MEVGPMKISLLKREPINREKNGLTYHLKQANHLKLWATTNNVPHLIFYGPSGAGKKTRIKCFLRELYGPGAERTHMLMKSFTTPSNKKLEIQTISSNYHIELSPSDVGVYDRVVVQDVIKEMAQTSQIDAASQKSFKVVVLCEADFLTRDAQDGLRRTMEKYQHNCRLILCCENYSRIIEPLQSRCIAVNVAAPTDEQVANIVENVCQAERVGIPRNVLQQIVEKSSGNLRRALLMVEATRMQDDSGTIPADANVPVPEWETYLKETAEMILKKQSSDTLFKVRTRIYEILSRCIPPQIVFDRLLDELLPACDDVIVPQIVSESANFEHRLLLGQKPIFHIEAFIAAFMDIYLTHLTNAKRVK
ncbi:unnamed protein product [Caenorhabditis auriculariae]|uniref:Replication factor C subunit 3 n=1 Tax=Caenorhabditis auriculariae TaxID=2777116 RepID=A0A8S1HIB2_9PELO|nr:unnamed protein product [Caenorhabditis auriculariae]